MKIENNLKLIRRSAFLTFSSNEDIQNLGNTISKIICPNTNFGGLEEYIYDEIPAIYIKNVLGLKIILCGFSGEDSHYNLKILEQTSLRKVKDIEIIQIDLSYNIYLLLKDIEDLKFSEIGSPS